MARLKHFTKDVKLEVRLDPNSTHVTRFGAKAGHVFEVPDGYYANYCIKKLGCVLITPQSEMPVVKPEPVQEAPSAVEDATLPAAPEPEPVPEPEVAVEPEPEAAVAEPAEVPEVPAVPEATEAVDATFAEDFLELAPAVDEPPADAEPVEAPKKKAGRPPKAK